MNEVTEIGWYFNLLITVMVILTGINLYKYTKEQNQ